MVPDLSGKVQAEAQQALQAQRLTIAVVGGYSDTIPKGTVIDWSPKGSVPRDSTVTVTVSQGKEPKPVPSLLDRLYEEGAKILGDLGFIPKRQDAFSDTVAKGQVIGTQPPTDQPVPPGTEVTILVSKGPETVAVPDVSGMTIDDAVSKLQDAGFEVGGPYGPPNAKRAYSTSPSAGTKVKKGALVDLFVGR
jgi:serine/threonine-protein kinase